MKTKWLAFVAIVSALAVTALAAKPSATPLKKRGTDILHYFVFKALVNDGAETRASGRVDAKQNRQGNADNRRLDIAVRGLTTNAPYQLLALVGDDTNYTHIADFSADRKGAAFLRYEMKNKGSHGRGRSALPGALDPVYDIRELTVWNSTTQAVLTADLTAPDKLHYLIKRDLSSGDVSASLLIQATSRKARLRLRAGGLNATNEYALVLNDVIDQTIDASASGELDITRELVHPGDILDLRTLALWDSGSNVVVSTELP